MHAVVSLFDKNDHNVRSLSGKLEKTLGTHLYSMMPDPHLSYQGATKYHSAKLEGRLRRFARRTDRKSTRLNSSHGYISYAVFCLKKKKHKTQRQIILNLGCPVEQERTSRRSSTKIINSSVVTACRKK